jgi:hypothetical protein
MSLPHPDLSDTRLSVTPYRGRYRRRSALRRAWERFPLSLVEALAAAMFVGVMVAAAHVAAP